MLETNFELEDFSLEPIAPRFILELKGGSAQLRGSPSVRLRPPDPYNGCYCIR
jgi:hypothetical protein